MKYSRYIYAYPFFAAGILLVNLIAYLLFGREYFSAQVEMTTSWYVASAIYSLVLIPTYGLGVACLIFIGQYKKLDFTDPASYLFIWAFVSGALLVTVPVLDFIFLWISVLQIFFAEIWLPILLTSLAFFAIKKRGVTRHRITDVR